MRSFLLLLPLLAACLQEGGTCENVDENASEFRCSGTEALECVDGTWEVSEACSCTLFGTMECRMASES